MGPFAIIFGILSGLSLFFISSGWAIFFAILSSLSGLFSAVDAHSEQLRKVGESWPSKIILGLLTLTSFVVSEPLARILITKVTFLDSSLFPHAVTLMSYILMMILLALIISVIVSVLAVLSLEKIAFDVHAFGRMVASLLTIVLVIAITFGWPGILSGLPVIILEWTSFTKNGRGSLICSSVYPHLPEECKKAAEEAGIHGNIYTCIFQPMHCSNLSGDSQISFISNHRVAVLKYVPKADVRSSVLPLMIELHQCSVDRRYTASVEDKIPSVTSGCTTRNLTPDFFNKEGD